MSLAAESGGPGIIIGGGIAGLTAALALLRQGIKVTIFEQARAVGDVGAGISIGATAAKGLYSLGLKEALVRTSDRLLASAALHYQTGEKLGGVFAARDLKGEELARAHMIHRADLFSLLQSAVESMDAEAMQFGRRFSHFVQDSDGVTAYFADGEAVRGAFLLGCDGIRSVVRTQMFGAGDALRTGQAAYRFLVPMERALPHLATGVSNIFVGPQRSLLHYPIRQGRLLNCVALICGVDWSGEGWSHRVAPAELQGLFAGWHSTVTGLASEAPEEKTAKWALFDRDPIPEWVQGRVALVGDSAHPMLPFLGLGAATGIEDAVILGRAFGLESDVAAALKRYETARVGRAGELLLDSRRQAQVFADGPGSTRGPKTTMKERMDYDPATVAI